MKIILYLLSFIIFCNYSAYSEEWVDIYSNSGDKLQIALPDGYCDVTDTILGEELIIILNKSKSAVLIDDNNFNAKIIFKLCSQVNDQNFSFPWGYIFLNSEKYPSSYSQEDLNKFESAGYKKNYVDEIKDKLNNSLFLKDSGVEIETFGVSEVILQDENILLSYNSLIESKGEESNFIQVSNTGIILHNNYAIYMYMYDLKVNAQPFKNAQLLLNAAKLTKSR